jgi:hypothetical protein
MTQDGEQQQQQSSISKTSSPSSSSVASVAALSKNPLVVLLEIARTEGVGRLWSGLIPRAARAIGSGAIQFASYELSQNFMQSSGITI